MPLRVKFLAKFSSSSSIDYWRQFLPNASEHLGEVSFIFDTRARDYDWLIVYDDLPSSGGERHTLWNERLACARENTLHITTEPATIKVYGNAFLAQFGHVLTSQEPWAIKHPNVIRSQCGLLWFYGKSHRQAAAEFPTAKTHEISTVCSTKRQRHTLHSLRYDFTRFLKAEMPELEVYGHGHREIQSKIEALDPFRYHLAIENHHARHHWTEKLADAFLAGCLPFYFGCPNVFDYFPEESLIPLDVRHWGQSLETIRQNIRDQAYPKRLPAVREARRLVLDEYALFPMLSRLIPSLHQPIKQPIAQVNILSRHAWRKSHPLGAIVYGLERWQISRRARPLKEGFRHNREFSG